MAALENDGNFCRGSSFVVALRAHSIAAKRGSLPSAAIFCPCALAVRHPAPPASVTGVSRPVNYCWRLIQPAHLRRIAASPLQNSISKPERSLCNISGSLCAARVLLVLWRLNAGRYPAPDARAPGTLRHGCLTNALSNQPRSPVRGSKRATRSWAQSTTRRYLQWLNWFQQYWSPAPLCASLRCREDRFSLIVQRQRAIQGQSNTSLPMREASCSCTR